MGEILVIVYPGAEFLFICRSVNLEKELFASKTQLWDRYNTDTYITTGRNCKK